MARSVGIELTEAAVKILQLEQNGKKAKVAQFREVPVPVDFEAPWEERAARAVKDAFAQAKVPKSNVYASIDSGEAILREVSLPFKNEEQIRKTVRFELESQVHNYTIEQLVVSYYRTGETDKGSLILAAAVPKTVVARTLKILQQAGVDPVALDLDVCAVFNAMTHAGAIDTDEPHLLIYGTTKFTKLVFIERRQPKSIRSIRFSLPSKERARAGAGSKTGSKTDSKTESKGDETPGRPIPIVLITPEEAARFKDLDLETQTELVEILAKEVSRFLLANAASANPAHILLTGAFEDEHASQMLEAATQIPVRTVNLLERIEPAYPDPKPEHSSRMGVPLGLALKGAGADALGMDFRQEEFSYRKKYEAIKTTALVTVELVVVFLAAIALHLHFKAKDIGEAQRRVFEEQANLYSLVAASEETLTEPRMAYSRMEELWSKYKGPLGQGGPIERSAREVWRELFAALQAFQSRYANRTLGEGTLFVELEGLTVSQGGDTFEMSVRGKVRNLEFAAALRDEIRKGELFKDAEFVGGLPPEGDLNRFTLKVTKSRRQG